MCFGNLSPIASRTSTSNLPTRSLAKQEDSDEKSRSKISINNRIGSRIGGRCEARSFANHGPHRYNPISRCRAACLPRREPVHHPWFLRDIIIQPGSKTAAPPMMNAMVCHITEGELRIEQEGKTFTAKKDFVWTCNKDTKEQAFNDGTVVATMRITDLKA
jgi:hypothetical protein